MTRRRAWQTVLLSVVLIAAVTVVVLVVTRVAPPYPRPAPASTPTPTPTGPFPLAEIAPLEPAQPAVGQYDEHPAVQVYRETAIILAWANLTNDPYIGQVTQYIDFDSSPGLAGYSESIKRYEFVALGPSPEIIQSLTENPDGSTTLRTCSAMPREVTKNTGELRYRSTNLGFLTDVTLSPLTAREQAELAARGLDAPPLRVREYDAISGECDDTGVIAQEFASWQDYAPIGDYGNTISWPVAVVGEDGEVEYRTRDDMP